RAGSDDAALPLCANHPAAEPAAGRAEHAARPAAGIPRDDQGSRPLLPGDRRGGAGAAGSSGADPHGAATVRGRAVLRQQPGGPAGGGRPAAGDRGGLWLGDRVPGATAAGAVGSNVIRTVHTYVSMYVVYSTYI
ncbi:hypothetical protein T310_9132, partial [Rasamsonia emersonii CBS 393.64]